MQRWGQTIGAGVVGALVATLIGPGLAWAGHQWSDVKSGTFFHDSIGNFTDAGCATGYGDGTFRAGNPVLRGQMARFINACGGRAEFDRAFTTALPNTITQLPSVTMEAGALGGTGGLVWLHGDADVTTGSTGGFSCEVRVRLRRGTQTLDDFYVDIADTGQIVDDAEGSTSALVPVAPLSTTEFNMAASVTCSGQIGVSLALTALYFPFGGDGAGGEAEPLPVEDELPRGT